MRANINGLIFAWELACPTKFFNLHALDIILHTVLHDLGNVESYFL